MGEDYPYAGQGRYGVVSLISFPILKIVKAAVGGVLKRVSLHGGLAWVGNQGQVLVGS